MPISEITVKDDHDGFDIEVELCSSFATFTVDLSDEPGTVDRERLYVERDVADVMVRCYLEAVAAIKESKSTATVPHQTKQ